ncbi:conserved hypothetical protein [Candidatus Zixiibacteriota bacterium]|nr:conserved hypothetical protein [candidate division Zixibacteria bacterium]
MGEVLSHDRKQCQPISKRTFPTRIRKLITVYYQVQTSAMVKKIFVLILIVTALSIAAIYFVSTRPLYDGPQSGHFDGKYFHYNEPDHTFADHLKWLWEMKTVDWPEWIDNPPMPAPIKFVSGDSLKITYINHATVLIQTDSLNLLTDPIWSMRAGPFSFMGAKRIRAPGIKIGDLPKIDIILISHDHFDHLDLPTLRTLVQRDNPRIIAGLGIGELLASEEISKVTQLDWWQSTVASQSQLKITFVPSKHNSGRFIWGNNRTLWGGFVIEGKAGNIYFAGDTGFGPFINEIKNHFGSFRATILPLGNYEKRWFMKEEHINPEEAVLIHLLLESRQSIGMHFATFCEHPEQAVDAHVRDLHKALLSHNLLDSDFWILRFGEGRMVPD